MGDPLFRGQGNQSFDKANGRSAAKRGQTVPYDINGAPTGSAGDAVDVAFAPAGNIASTNVQSALEELDTEKEPSIAAGTTGQYWRGDKSWQTLDKTAVGLGSVDNTADAAKNVLGATKLTTSRSFTITGDAGWTVNFDGSANVTSALTLATVNGSPGSFGSASKTLTATVNGKGLVTALAETNIAITASQVTDFSTGVGLYNAATATKLLNARTIGISGDATWSSGSFDGSANVTAALTLATVNSNVGSFGSATQVATFTVNAKGLTTAASNVAIAIPSSQVTDFNEAAQDTVGGILTDTATIDFTYDAAGGSITADVKADSITFAKMQNIATDRLIGRDTAATGDPEEITVSGGLEWTGSGGIQTSALTGDATKTAGGTALTLATVNSNVGTFGSVTKSLTVTANGKGLITAISEQTVTPAVGSITGLGTGVATALVVNVGSAGAFVTLNGAGGTPSSLTLTNATGLPISTGVSGLGSNVATFLATASSANLRAAITDETGGGLAVFNDTPTLLTPVFTGLPTGSGVASASTASTLAARTSNGLLAAVNFISDYTTTATAAGTTTLTVASTFQQYFTGSTTQTVTLPVASTLTLGHQFLIVNNSTGAVTVNSSGGNAVIVLAGGTSAQVTCILTSGTSAASWSAAYFGDAVTSGKKLSVSNTLTLAGTDGTTMTFPTTSATIARTDAANTFTGHQTIEGVTSTGATGTGKFVFDTSPTLVTPLLGTPSSGTLTNCTGLPIAGLTASTSTAIGVGSIELGHASDTTITRASAGVVAIEGSNIIVSGGALGTPSSGTLTNCTGLPVAGITASTSTALGVGSLEIGHASDTTVSRVSAGDIQVEGNRIFRVGGTDVPVADGGTGASTAASARTNLGVSQPYLIERIYSSIDNTPDTVAVDSTSYGYPATAFGCYIDLDFFAATHFRIIAFGLSNEAAQTVTMQLQDLSGFATAHTGSTGDLVMTNTSGKFDSGWITRDDGKTGLVYYILAMKGSNGTVDATFRNLDIHWKIG